MRLSLIGVLCLASIITAQNDANCNTPCENYLSELKVVDDLDDVNVYNPGGVFSRPTQTITYMCQLTGSDIQTCFVCSTGNGQGLSGASDLTLLDAWWQTCVNYQQQGIDSAYACWQSIPTGSQQCLYLASDPDHPQGSTTTTTTVTTTTTTTSSQSSPASSSSQTTNAGWSWQSTRDGCIAGLIACLIISLFL